MTVISNTDGVMIGSGAMTILIWEVGDSMELSSIHDVGFTATEAGTLVATDEDEKDRILDLEKQKHPPTIYPGIVWFKNAYIINWAQAPSSVSESN